MALQTGIVGMYQVGLFTALDATCPATRGLVAGIVVGGFGLSGAVWTTAFQDLFESDLFSYFVGTGSLFAMTSFIALIWLPKLAASVHDTARNSWSSEGAKPLLKSKS